MVSLLKTVGYGVSFVLLLPIIAVVLVLYCVYCILNYICHELVALPRFFMGKSSESDDKLMKQLEEKKKEQRAYEDMKKAQTDAFQQNMFNNMNNMNNFNNTQNNENKEGEQHE